MGEKEASTIRENILARRAKLEQVIASAGEEEQLKHLLSEVDAALERMDGGTFGLCEVCQEPIEAERITADPLVRFCIDHLTPVQQRALESDLSLAARIQKSLLPVEGVRAAGWEAAYHYEGASLVSGDYCDLLDCGARLYFVVGDVSGKGVASAMLMAHLHATFRTLVSMCMPLQEIMERASRMFCESTLPSHFATMACGIAEDTGEIELCIAGHLPVLFTHDSDVRRVESTGLPLGMFCEESFSIKKVQLAPGDSLVLYTDGLSESVDPAGTEYGIQRLEDLLRAQRSRPPKEIISACIADLQSFRDKSQRSDDLTIMVLQREQMT